MHPVRWIFLIALYLTSLNISAVESDKNHHNFQLEASRMNIGGNARLPMHVNRHSEFHLGIEIAPSFGIFLAKQLELRTSFNVNTQFVFSKQANKMPPPVFWGMSVAALYYFNTKTILWPYLGGGLGFEVMNWNIFSLGLTAELPVGILIALNDNFALDIGMPVSIKISVRSLTDTVSFPIGVMGFRYYFN